MTQQINLYQPILRREKKVFSAVTMLQVLGVIAALMAILYGFSAWQLGQLDAELAALRGQEQALVARVTTATRGLHTVPESRELRQRVELARSERDLKRQLLDLLESRQNGTATGGGFAAAFTGLARQDIDGLWLTRIVVDQDAAARDLALHGRAERAELVPELVQRLGGEPAFAGIRFEHMRVFLPEDGGALAFELSTRVPVEARR